MRVDTSCSHPKKSSKIELFQAHLQPRLLLCARVWETKVSFSGGLGVWECAEGEFWVVWSGNKNFRVGVVCVL